MKWKNLIKVAFQSILKNRMRSVLTMLGIIIGVGAVIIMVSVGEGTQERIQGEISSLGSNLLMVRPGSNQFGGIHRGAGSMNSLTLKDAEELREKNTLLNAVSPVVRSNGQVVGGGTNWSTTINGVTPEYLTVKDWSLEYGTFFTERDVRSRNKVVVLGATVAEELFPGIDPVGQQIRFKNVPFKVVGVLEEKGQAAMGMDQDDVILSPSTTVLYRLTEGKYIHEIDCSAKDTESMDAAIEEITAILRQSHKIEPGEDDDFSIRSQLEMTEAMTSITGMLTMLLGSIAGVSLIVGGIGIMNIMLVSVTERTREIGIRLAIGARENDVLTQFLVEAMVLSLIGGLLGIITGVGVALLVSSYTSVSTRINEMIILTAFLFSGGVGVFFGYYPARKAAALDPIEALRYE